MAINIRGATLSGSIIINPYNYHNLIIDRETNFNNAIIDDPTFIDYITKITDKVPNKIK